MAYNYSEERPRLFTPEGVSLILKVKDEADRLTKIAGCFTVINVISGDSFQSLAAVDYLVENKHLALLSNTGSSQNHVYKSNLLA